MSRPEYLAPPEIFYNDEEARKYTQNSRIIDIQVQMSERAIELLVLPEDTPCYLLDIGCGSGLSGSVLEDQGHFWVGMDISTAMLDIANEREVEGDLLLTDMGQGCPFRAGAFDGAISISALQWLCNADKTSHNPVQRLYKFFSTLYACLSRSARAVLQFYPENSDQMELLTTQAMKAGFYGGVVVDYPNSTKAKKFFLVLMTGGNMPLPKALGTNEDSHGKFLECLLNTSGHGKQIKHHPSTFSQNSLRLCRKNSLHFIMDGKELDLYRQTPVRYLGYSNEVGEAFRSIIGSKWVNFTYAVATAYVLADTTDKSIKSYKENLNEKNHFKKVVYTTTDTLVWQMLASVAIPGLTINRLCALSNFLLKRSEILPKNTRRWVVTGIGLATIPFIIKPIDDLVDFALDESIRKLQPK